MTGLRTQGAAALMLANPGIEARLTSSAVSSTATQLATLSVPGAVLAIDLRFPGNKQLTNGGTLRLSLTSPSRGLNKATLGKVDLGKLRTGTYQTISFPLTDQARRALAGGVYNDLSFELMLTSTVAGEYLFDNLRVRSVQGVTATAATRPPDGYGGSVDFDVDLGITGDAPAIAASPAATPGAVEQTFDVGPIQVPDRFHVKVGTADPGTSVRLDLGYGPSSLIATCVYMPDPTDAKVKSYLFSSCTGGPQPGDIVGASWARLQVVGGVSPTRIRAQLARLPLGDQMGSGLIPPMPTFWGEEDGCILDDQTGGAGTTSQSCLDNLAESSKIVDDYFKAATQANPKAGWIVSPTPEFAKRHGDGEPESDTPAPTPFAAARSSVGFATPIYEFSSGHLNQGGLFDAYWELQAHVLFNSFPDSDRMTTHMDAQFLAGGVIFGLNATALAAQVSADSDTGQTIPNQLPGSGNGAARLYVFGTLYPKSGELNLNRDLPYDIPLFTPAPLDLIRLQYWVFKISGGFKAEAGLSLGGQITSHSIEASIVPVGSIEGHLFGGIDLFLVSGGIDASIDLIRVEVPITAKVGWTFDHSVSSCAAAIDGSLDADLVLSSGGGNVSLVASTGLCPVCDTYSLKLFSWAPIAKHTAEIVHRPLGSEMFPLPQTLCPGRALNVDVRSPKSQYFPNGLPFVVFYGSKTYDLQGFAPSNNAGQEIDCSNFTWSTAAPDVITGQGCAAKIVFANAPHLATIKLDVNHKFKDVFDRDVFESGSATATVSVSKLDPGVTISKVSDLGTNPPSTPSFRPLTSLSAPSAGGYILEADYLTLPDVDAADIKYRWTVLHNGITTDITCSTSNLDGCVPDGLTFSLKKVYWTPPAVNDGFGYDVTFSAISKATGEVIDSDTFLAKFYALN